MPSNMNQLTNCSVKWDHIETFIRKNENNIFMYNIGLFI